MSNGVDEKKEAGSGRTQCDNQIELATGKESLEVVYERTFVGRLRDPCHLQGGFVEIDRIRQSPCNLITEVSRHRAPGLEVRSERVQ